MHYDDASYYRVLKEIDRLRLMGVAVDDPLMLKVRIELRDILEYRCKKDTKTKKVVPNLTGIKTIVINPRASSEQRLAANDVSNKYEILGVVIALLGVMWNVIRTQLAS